MNMDFDRINRSLSKLGKGKYLSREDKDDPDKKKKEFYDICKSFYLSTYLEALRKAPWTSARKLKRLFIVPGAPTGKFKYVYGLPHDCVRIVKLASEDVSEFKGGRIYTDDPAAELDYVSNGKVLPQSLKAALPPQPGGKPDMVVSPGAPGEHSITPDEEFVPTSPFEIDGELSNPLAEDDYDEYETQELEPNFWEYMEALLAANLVMDVAQDPRLHTHLLQVAELVKQEAVAITKSVVKFDKGGQESWTDRMFKPISFGKDSFQNVQPPAGRNNRQPPDRWWEEPAPIRRGPKDY